MIETFKEFKSELEMLQNEIREKKDALDSPLVASWVDKVVILLQNMCNRLDLLCERVDVISEKK